MREIVEDRGLLELVAGSSTWDAYWANLQDLEPEERLRCIIETVKGAGEEGIWLSPIDLLDLDQEFNRYLLLGYDYFRYSWDVEDMYRWVPQEIQENFGRVGKTMHDGWVLELDEGRKDEIIAILESKYGYKCQENPALISLTM